MTVTATGVGSMPGDDQRAYDEAVRVVVGELPDLAHLPEVPGRGAIATMTGRTLALVAELGADLQPAGWRLTGGGGGAGGVDQRRARSLMAQDLDTVEEQLQGYTGPFKVQVSGAWTLAATVERPRGDKVLADRGARRELAQALAEGLGDHVADVRRRVPGADRIVVQLDEPALPAVLDGRVPTASGFHKHRRVDLPEASEALEWTLGAVAAAGAEPWVHSCAPGTPWAALRNAGARGLSVDHATLSAADHDALAEALEAGETVALGVVPSLDPTPAPTDAHVTETVLRWLDMLGLDPAEVGERLVVTPSCGLAGASLVGRAGRSAWLGQRRATWQGEGMRRLGTLCVVAGLAATLTAGGDTAVATGEAREVPITQRAIAAMALEHAPVDTTTRRATWTGPRYRGGGLGADLRYRGDGESDGDLLEVFVTPRRGPADPCRGRRPHCESRTVEGGRLTLSWGLEEPEEDPGYVGVLMQRGDERVSVTWSGDAITGDPRRQHLFIPVATLEAIAQDPRISVTTTQDVVDAGAALADWEGGEPDPHAGDRVPATNRAVAWSYWLHFGGYRYNHGLRASPLRAAFGKRAVGGRFWVEGQGRDYPRKMVDVVAAHRRPHWMSRQVCRTPRFAGHCVRIDGRLGPRVLAWVPGPRTIGQVWAVGLRDHEVVAVRYSRLRVPERRQAVVALAQWRLLRGFLQDRAFGLETFKYVLDSRF